MSMTIELGKIYITRAGHKVEIENVDYSYSQPFFGVIKTLDNKHVRVASFNAAGMYHNGKESEFDIVKELA